MKTISRGARGDAVRVLQYILGVAADGDFGPKTEAALYEQYRMLACGDILWAMIAAKLPQLKLFSAGKNAGAVKAMQVLMGVTPTGLAGPVTVAALKRVQAAAPGLKVTSQCGPGTWKYMLTEYVPPFDAAQPIDYKQYDKRWAKLPFGKAKGTIQNSGCGATAVADMLAFLFGTAITPATVTDTENKLGYATPSNGTARAFFDWLSKQYQFEKYQRTYSTDDVIAALMEGAIVIALMGPDYWTKGGHYICCWKYDPNSDRIYACDPASATRKSAISKIFREQRKEFFIYFT